MARYRSGMYLKELRELMRKSPPLINGLQAFIVPTGDSHQNEYLAPCDKHREFISGFTGSCGTAVVTSQKALLWTDGRYFAQALQELDENWQLMKDGLPDTPKIEAFLSKELPKNSYVGVDPSTISIRRYQDLCAGVKDAGHTVVCTTDNLISQIWKHRPDPPSEQVLALGLQYTGKACHEKVAAVRQKLKEQNCSALAVTALDEVAWLFNLRGSDIAYNPVFFSYAVVTDSDVTLFVDESKLGEKAREQLTAETSVDGVSFLHVQPYSQFHNYLKKLVTTDPTAKNLISHSSSQDTANAVPQKNQCLGSSPIALMKAVKNHVELQGIRVASVRDSAALCQYFCWLEKEVPHGEVTEMSGAERLRLFRTNLENFVGLSFETISGSGPNGAIIHYRVTPETNRAITASDMYLCDSGAQFWDGTTDVTRTMHFGQATAHEKECYTRVLKGHINLAKTIFPHKCRGALLDCLARTALWEVGLNFNHGTGHGVGAFLNVHEGPQGISPRATTDEGLEAGMLVTDEPGYYEDGAFGIRIENVCVVTKTETKHKFDGMDFLQLRPMTMVPYETELMVPELLTPAEVQFINDYHVQVRECVSPILEQMGDGATLKWLGKKAELLG